LHTVKMGFVFFLLYDVETITRTQKARLHASHAGNRGSIPLGATKFISNTVQYIPQVVYL